LLSFCYYKRNFYHSNVVTYPPISTIDFKFISGKDEDESEESFNSLVRLEKLYFEVRSRNIENMNVTINL
jgi:hypothetical protein